MNSDTKLLNKNNTLMLHGIAILMMVYHHLFINGNTWFVNKGKSIFDFLNFINIGRAETAQYTFAWFCKICVAVFAFTSGYAMFVQFEKRCENNISIINILKYCLQRFWSFYKKYVLCFIFFVGYEYLTGNKDGFDYSLSNVILSLVGVRASFNGTLWYVAVYYCMLILSPIFYLILKKIKIRDYLIIIGLGILSVIIAFVVGNGIAYLKSISTFIQNYVIIYILIFAEGMFCARYNWIDIIGSRLNIFTSIVLLMITYVSRVLLIRAPSDSLFDLVLTIPFIISVTKIISKSKITTKALCFLGKYSSYIWYCHAYFYSYLFFRLVIKCDLSIIVYVQVIVYSLLASLVFTEIEKIFNKLLNRLNSKGLNL